MLLLSLVSLCLGLQLGWYAQRLLQGLRRPSEARPGGVVTPYPPDALPRQEVSGIKSGVVKAVSPAEQRLARMRAEADE